MSDMFRINVGCGQTPTEGWRNFDNSMSLRMAKYPALGKILGYAGFIEKDNLDFINFLRRCKVEFADAAKRIPLENSSVEVLYSCHMLEHLDRREAVRFLLEAIRVLRPDGIIRLAVPDISKNIANYIAGGNADDFIASTYMCQPRPQTVSQKLKMAIIGPRHHNWMYDGRSLSALLARIGFENPQCLPAGRTTIPTPGDLDLHERSDESVYVEARKPQSRDARS